jgi:hypothetical protein
MNHGPAVLRVPARRPAPVPAVRRPAVVTYYMTKSPERKTANVTYYMTKVFWQAEGRAGAEKAGRI